MKWPSQVLNMRHDLIAWSNRTKPKISNKGQKAYDQRITKTKYLNLDAANVYATNCGAA